MKRLLLASAVFFASVAADAATTGNNLISPQTPNRGIVQFLQGTDSAGTYKTLYTAGANGSKCYGGYETNNDASATHLITIEVVNATVKYGGVAFTTASNDGYANTVPAKAFMSATLWPGLPTDNANNPYLMLVSGDTLQATFATALTSTDKISLVISCSDF